MKAVVQFRGREIAHADLGKKLLMRFAADLTAYRHGGRHASPGRPQRARADQPGEGVRQGKKPEKPEKHEKADKAKSPRLPRLRKRCFGQGRRQRQFGVIRHRDKMREVLPARIRVNMYNAFFGFTQNPFNMSPDPSFLFRSPQHEEALASLIYGVQSRKGFIALTGEVGTGKTTMLECLRDFLNAQQIAFASLFNSRLTWNSFSNSWLTISISAATGSPRPKCCSR